MSDAHSRSLAAAGLTIGAVLGMAGTFAPTPGVRGLAWGLDGTALIVAAALLTIHHIRRGNDLVAAGFLVFGIGEGLIVSVAAMGLEAGVSAFGAGVGLWATSIAMVSAPRVMPLWLRVVGLVASLLFAVVAVQIFSGRALTPLSEPLPFFAYPFLAATLVGWAWVHYHSALQPPGVVTMKSPLAR